MYKGKMNDKGKYKIKMKNENIKEFQTAIKVT